MSFYGGAELVVVKLANYLTKKGIKNAILTLEISQEIKKNLTGTDIIMPKKPLRFPPRIPFSITLPLVVSTLARLLHKNLERFDVVNVHNFPAELATFHCSRRVVWMCNEPPQLYFTSPKTVVRFLNEIITAIDKIVVRKCVDRVVVADEFNAKRFEKIYGIRPTIIPYGIDYEFFSKGDGRKARKMFDLDKSDFVLLQVGVLTPMKNQLESIRVVENLRTEITCIKLVLAGYGEDEYAQSLKKYVREHKLEKQVIFTGHLPRTIVRDLYAACDVCLFPVKPQGGWLSPFEALCSNRPIIVSTQMTAADIIARNKIGVVTDDFTKIVQDIYTHPEKYIKVARVGRKWVKKNLGWQKFCERMVETFVK